MKSPLERAIVAALVIVSAAALTAQDWPQWRGPNRDGAIAQFSEPPTWPAALTRRWHMEIGPGYATPVVVGDRVYAFSRERDEEVLRAHPWPGAGERARSFYGMSPEQMRARPAG